MLLKTQVKKKIYWRFASISAFIFILWSLQGEKVIGSDVPQAYTVYGQEAFIANQDTSKAVRVQPVPPGGSTKVFRQYITENYRYPKEAIKAKVRGRMTVSFVVNRDGSVSNVKVLRGLGYGTGGEAIRVFSNSPAWKLGLLNGKPVRVKYTISIVLNWKDANKNPHLYPPKSPNQPRKPRRE